MEIMASLSKGNKKNGDLAVQCALLHDIIEDPRVPYEQIIAKFGIDVAEGVQALTKNINNEDKREQMKDSLIRIKKQPKEIWMVKEICCHPNVNTETLQILREDFHKLIKATKTTLEVKNLPYLEPLNPENK